MAVERGISTIQVFLTRPACRNGAVPQRLESLGFRVHEFPALELRPVEIPRAAPRPEDFDVVVFVSRYAAQRYLDWLDEWDADGEAWPSTTIAATVGASSALALRASGIVPTECIVHPPATTPQDSESLLAELNARSIRLKRVLVVRGTRGREWLAETLSRQGVAVEILPVYERAPATWSAHQESVVANALHHAQCSVFLLTSSEGVTALADRLARLRLLDSWRNAGFVVLHERIGATLQSVLAVEPDKDFVHYRVCMPDDDSIVEAIQAVARQAAKP